MSNRKVLPVTLITGFLGAGKTTLLEHVLSVDTGLKIAIIENEFGDVGIDGSIVNAPRGAVFELNDGCVCCTVREDLREVLVELVSRRDEFDHVLIETTGLAEPEPVLRLFDQPNLREHLSLNGVVTVVDAHHLEQSLDEVTTCAEQITYADLIILNKIDGLDAAALNSKEERVKQLNPLATLVRAERSQIDVSGLLDLGSRRSTANITAPHAHGHQGHDHHHDHAHDHHHDHAHDHHHDHAHDHQHDESIRPAVVEAPGNIDIDALDLWLGRLARGRDPMLLRMKGILAVEGADHAFIFNGVRSAVDIHPGRSWGSDARYSRIVFIGRGLDSAALQQEFDACALQSG